MASSRNEAGRVNRVHAAGLRQVPQRQERRDRQEGLDSGRPLADDPPRLEPVHPARELPADQDDGEQEARLHGVAQPLDARAARPQLGAGEGDLGTAAARRKPGRARVIHRARHACRP